VISADYAWDEFESRMRQAVAPPRATANLGGWMKRTALESGVLEPLLNLSPARTAEDLTAAAALEPVLSDESRRRALAAEMLERLDTLRRRHTPRPRVSLVSSSRRPEAEILELPVHRETPHAPHAPV
jgi:hypothetical protein